MAVTFKTIRSKLIAIILLVAVLTIVPTIMLSGWLRYRELRREMSRNIEMTARLVGEYAISPLVFQDRDGANAVLNRLSHIPSIRSAMLFDQSGAVFALFHRPGKAAHTCSIGQLGNRGFSDGFFCIALPVTYDGTVYGRIAIHAETNEVYAQTRAFFMTLLPWAVIILGLALFLTLLLQRTISGPITHLAEITRRITTKADFSIRAPGGRDDEIGDLCSGFNSMLAHLSQREVQRDRARKEKDRLADQLHQAQKMESVGRLAGGVAHDFNNILSVINGYAELSLMTLDEDHPLFGRLTTIMESGQRAARLTQQLLAFSRKQVVHKALLNVRVEVDNILKMIQRLLGEDIDIHAVHNGDKTLIMGDRSQLEQIILNLSINARDAMPEGGRLTIETGSVILSPDAMIRQFDIVPGPYARIVVTDTGEGIPMELLDRIFDPFFTTKEQGKGTGLGLSTVYGIIKQNNGYIDVYSETGNGTAFKIYLPLVNDQGRSATRPKSADALPDRKGTETILLLEDDAMLRQMIFESLSEKGYTVMAAENGDQGRELFNRCTSPIDLLITDMVMPGKNGLDIAREFQGRSPGLRVILMSGYTENAYIREGNIPSDMIFINKPVTPASLCLAVANMLDEKTALTQKSVPGTS